MFLHFQNVDRATQALLIKAYKSACDELIADYYLGASQIGGLTDVMVAALMDFYRAGQRSEARLSEYAVSRALSEHDRREGRRTNDA